MIACKQKTAEFIGCSVWLKIFPTLSYDLVVVERISEIQEMENLFDKNVEYTSMITTGLRKFFRRMGRSLDSFVTSPSFFREMDMVMKNLKLDADHQTVW